MPSNFFLVNHNFVETIEAFYFWNISLNLLLKRDLFLGYDVNGSSFDLLTAAPLQFGTILTCQKVPSWHEYKFFIFAFCVQCDPYMLRRQLSSTKKPKMNNCQKYQNRKLWWATVTIFPYCKPTNTSNIFHLHTYWPTHSTSPPPPPHKKDVNKVVTCFTTISLIRPPQSYFFFLTQRIAFAVILHNVENSKIDIAEIISKKNDFVSKVRWKVVVKIKIL